jgi:hypothetical protein
VSAHLAGSISTAGGFTIASGAGAIGVGTITANVINGGVLSVGGPSTAGLLSISGNYTQSSGATLRAVITGVLAGTQMSRLMISALAINPATKINR